jgi:hypothetical protein
VSLILLLSLGVVAYAFQSITGIINSVGIVALSLPYVKNISTELTANPTNALTATSTTVIGEILLHKVLNALKQELPCQQDTIEGGSNEDGQGKGDGDNDDHDNLVMDDVTDLIGILAKVMGTEFIPHFDILLPPLMKFVDPDRIHSDRSMAIGCFAEVIAEFGPSAEKYIQSALPVISVGISDDMESVRRNSAYFVAALVGTTGKVLSPYFIQILQMLYPLCNRKESQMNYDSGGADIDNALSAVAKMIVIAPELLPLNSILPVLLAALPLRADHSEGPSVYTSLVNLLISKNSVAFDNFVPIITAFGNVLSPDSKAIDETKAIVQSCLKALASDSASSSILMNALHSISTTNPMLSNIISSNINC